MFQLPTFNSINDFHYELKWKS